jgi:drug/metabolite transporter (DMT)-like permease
MKRAYIQMHVAILLWGFTGILGRLISIEEFPLVWWRILITVLGLYGFLKWNGEFEAPSRKALKKIFFVGGTIALHWVTFFGSIKYSNVSVALSAMASTALFTAILAPIKYKRKPRLTEILLGLGIVAGIYIIFQFQQVYSFGIALGLISALLCAYFTIETKELLSNHGPRNLLLFELLGGLGTLTLLAPFYVHFFPESVMIPTTTDVGYLLILSLLCTVYAMQLSYQALQHVSPFVMNLSVNLEPVYSIVLAAFIFKEHEELNAGFYVGASIIILTVMLNGVIEWRNRPKKRIA